MSTLPRLALLTASLCLLGGCGSHSPKASSYPDMTASSGGNPIAKDSYPSAAASAQPSGDPAEFDDLPALNCGESRMAPFIGKPESEQVRSAVLDAVGHRLVRWVHPGQAVTMDYQPGRLNVIVDDHGMIAATRCG